MTLTFYQIIQRIIFLVLQALELSEGNTKALFRRAQAWQGLKEYNKAMVMSTEQPLVLETVQPSSTTCTQCFLYVSYLVDSPVNSYS